MLSEYTGVNAVTPDGDVLHRGAVVFLRDELAEVLEVFWKRDSGTFQAVWFSLDLGVQRLAETDRWAGAPRVAKFAARSAG